MSKIEHFCHKIHGWFDFHNLYYNCVHGFAKEDRKYTFAEIGCWKGASTSFMAVEIANSNKDIDFYCIDTWKGSKEHTDPTNGGHEPMCLEPNGIFPLFMKNLEPVKDYIKPIQKTSKEACEEFPDDFFDFVFIDASHEYEDIKIDIDLWFPKVKKDGVLAGHDYGWLGVKRAVDEFVAANDLKFIELVHDGPSWLIEK
jgi:hypothetical protein